MEAVLWQVLAGTRGGPNRARLLRALDERPRNANQLAEALDLDYKTIEHHLDVLDENDVVRSTDMQYGAVWLPTDRARDNWETVEDIIQQLDDVEPGDGAASEDTQDETMTETDASTDGGRDR
jgi:DNA-binding transcriptional ArsR family regulator